MGKPAARIGDMTSHGGSIVLGEFTVLIGGQPAARVGDNHVCPMVNPGTPPPPHVGGPIMPPGVPTVLIGGKPAACVGDQATCSGPPDAILPPGCPTVMIGSGGGGGGAGMGGSGKGEEASGGAGESRENHYLDVKFEDKGGKPIHGVEYSIKDPDKKEASGSLTGKVKKTGVKEGSFEVSLKVVSSAEWSAKDARVGDVVKLKAEISGFESGTPTVFRIFEKDFSSADDLIATLEAKTQGEKVETDWEYQYVEDRDDVQTEKEQQLGYSLPEYYFVVQVENSMARSGLLKFKDYVEVTLKDARGEAVPNALFRMHFSNGEVKEDHLDNNGYKKVENVPPGEWSVSFPDIEKTTRAEE